MDPQTHVHNPANRSLSLFATAPTASSPPCYGSGTVFAVGPKDSSFMLRVINRLAHALS